MKLIPVILSGGIGARLWPLSRAIRPKPFIQLDDGESLLQKTLKRAAALPNVSEIITVTNHELFFSTCDEYDALTSLHCKHTLILEPFGRNSAAAIALAAHCCQEKEDDSLLFILPADHLITNEAAFHHAVHTAIDLAQQGHLVTFGIEPDAPKTGYGYIQADEHHRVRQFVEKPDLETAQHYLLDGSFLWNAGLFCMPTKTVLQELETHCPALFEATHTCFHHAKEGQHGPHKHHQISPHHFEHVEDISIDYALLEKSSNVAVVPCDIGWSDIGSWIEFGGLKPADKNGNHTAENALLIDSHHCIVHAQKRLVAALGVDDLIIADTEDALLISKKERAQDVKQIASILKQRNHPSYHHFASQHRPWGHYITLQEGPGFQVRLLHIKPHQALSLQIHHHRSEHWVILEGEATVTQNEHVYMLASGQSAYIPKKQQHRLENDTPHPLTLIEVQCGKHLSEEDTIQVNA